MTTGGDNTSTLFAGTISGSGGGALVKIGSGIFTIAGTNTYSGGTTISAGTLQIGNGVTSGSITGNVTDNGTLAFDQVGSVPFAGTISGTGTVEQIGSGILTLTGNNTYSGATTVSSGTLQAGSATAFSANSAFNVMGLSVLDLNGFDVSIGSLAGVAGATVSLGAHTLTAGGNNASTTYAGLITGTGGLTKVGSGTLTLSGTSTYTGPTNINAGVLVGGALNSLNSLSAFVIANAASLDISSADQTIGSLAGAGGATVNLGTHILTTGGNNMSTTYAGLITGSGGLTKVGLGTLTLSGTSIYSGATNINAGVLAGGAPNSLSRFSAFAIANAAVLDISAADQTIGSLAGVAGVTVNLGAHTLTTGGDNTSTLFAGTISGSGGGALVKIGSGIFTIAGTNTYSAGTTISAGTLQIGNGVTNGSIVGDVTDNGTLAFDRSDTVAFGSVISGTGNLVQLGSGTLVLTGTNTYSGGTTISAGTLQIGNGGTTGSITGNVTDNGTLAFNRSDAMTFGGVISGTGSLVQLGSDTLTLTGNNTYSGNTTISAGTLQIGNGGTSGSVSGNVTDNGTVAFDRSDSVTFAGVINGTGNLVQLGSGTLVLNGNNSYSGGTTISAGTLQIGNGGTTGSIIGNVIDNAALVFDRRDTVTFGGIVSGAGKLVQLGTGNVILAGNNNYTGGTQINAGTLQIGNGGTGGNIAGNVTDNATFAFDRSDSVTFGGVISGTGALVQMGSGTLTLTGDNSYGGGTTINAGATLQLGNGATTGSIIGNVTDDGSLIFNRSNNVTFNGIISGSGNLAQNGSGTTILGGANTYSGGTIINNGALLVNNSQALGLGNVVVNGGVLGADPQPINVKGNYTQNAGGTLQLQVAGAKPGQYDTLNVGGNAALGGTLQLISLGFQPKAGNQLTLVTSGGAVSGQFARFVDPFSVSPGLNTIDLIYGKQSVVLEFLNQTTPVSPVIPTVPTVPTSPSVVPPTVIATINFASFALTPNQLAAANLLDAVQLNPRAVNLISFLDKVPFANLPSDFERISPDGLTAFYEISFSNANIQRLNLEGRMDDLHNGSTGFSSNMKVNGGTVNLENRADADGKSSKAVAAPVLQPGPENRWGVWVTGFGDFVSVDADANANGYNFTTGGVSLGIDYRITDQMAVGVMGEYSHTWTTLQPGGNIDVNSGRGGVYATWSYHGIYLDAAIYGGYNSYDSSRSVLGGLARGNTEGAELSTFISGGYDFHFGPLTVGPIAALQYTYAKVDGFSENGSLAPMQIQSDSVDSLRSDVGFRIFYQWQIGKILVEPSLKAAWEHEYMYSALPSLPVLPGFPGRRRPSSAPMKVTTVR